ncbi:hypothetical protein RQ81_19385, partial [Acinetobacter baumannii]
MNNLDYSVPSYIYKDSDRIGVFLASVIGFVGLFFVLRKIYLTGFSDIIDLLRKSLLQVHPIYQC